MCCRIEYKDRSDKGLEEEVQMERTENWGQIDRTESGPLELTYRTKHDQSRLTMPRRSSVTESIITFEPTKQAENSYLTRDFDMFG